MHKIDTPLHRFELKFLSDFRKSCKISSIFPDVATFFLEQIQIACFSPKFHGVSLKFQEFVQKQSNSRDFVDILQIPGIFEVKRAGRQPNEIDPPSPQTQRNLYKYV